MVENAPLLEQLIPELKRLFDGADRLIAYGVSTDFSHIKYIYDTERERELAGVFRISSIPQVLYIPVEGEPIILKGLYPKENIVEIIDEYLLKKPKPSANK